MARFLIRSFSDPRSYTEEDHPTADLPRDRTESYVPWAITPGGEVVYAKTGEHTSWRGGTGAQSGILRPYDSLVSQNRRRLAESDLGLLALDHPAFTREGVRVVNDGVKSYLDHLYVTNRVALTDTLFKEVGHYFFTAGGKGFGRISEADKKSVGPEGVRRGIFNALASGRLDQKLAIHDAVGRKVLEKLGGGPSETYRRWGPILRQDWFDDPKKRGRVNAPAKSGATTLGGIATASQSGQVGTVGIARGRGVDMFQRDLQRTREPEADEYYDDLDVRNLLFGAGISGTTGSLLQAAFAFGGVLRGEQLKQYVLAIVGYLVGGGMHSYHESMAVARKAGLAYTPGAYAPSLPAAFLSSLQCRQWRAKFYDIVVLGATHWRNNAGVLPSHLNRALK